MLLLLKMECYCYTRRGPVGFLVDPHFLSGSLTEGNIIVLLFEGINQAVILDFCDTLAKNAFLLFNLYNNE